MAWLSVQSAQLSMGGRALVNNITLNINAGDRIGIVGPNGMGKSTFLGLLSGAIEPDSGSIKVMGAPYITQLNQWQKPSCSTIWACAADANGQLRQTQEQLQHVEQAMANPDMTSEQLIELTEQWGRLSEKFSDMGGYEWEATVRAGLIALGFAESRFNDSPQHLSGGEQHRLALLQIILSGADIWLLDEPNNHLDVTTLQWLEEQIRRFRGACVVVSHDRAFLDHIATRIVSWEDGFFWSTAGNWTKYRNLREERLKTEEAQYQRLQEERLRLEQYIARFRSGTRAKQAQSRMKRLEKLGTGTAPSTRPRDLQLLHNSSGHSGHEPLAHIQSLVLKRPHRVWEPLSFKLPPHAKVALIGPNGTGKSTLLEALTVPRSEVHWMQDTAIGYLPQDAVTKLPQGVTGMDYLYDQGFVREEIYYLGSHFGLSKDLLESMIDGWSGGERTRLKLLEVLMQPTDLLLLDEPTNHLDIRMRLALESLIIGYPGAVIISSHDRAFLQATSTHTLWSTGSAFIWDKDPYREGRIAPRTS